MFVEPFGKDTVLNDRYRLVKQIGEGGMGQVWKAEDIHHEHRPVAIKFIARDKYSDAPEKRDRFRQEMRALARLDHTNIVHLIEFDETPDGTLYLVMNFVPGGSLQERLDKSGLDAATRDHVLKELCDALDYIHSQNIVHRDLKPANILFDASNHVRVGDFGLAKLVDTTYVASVFGGTPRFQSPEQSAKAIAATLTQGKIPTIDHRADIYALGVIAWLLFTGQYPDAPSSPPPDQLSPGLAQVLHKALAYRREDRYNSAGEFLEAITAAMSRRQKLSIAPGTMINTQYQLVAQIGEGGMGQVWKAKDTKHGNRLVAIKLIRDKYGDDSEKRVRFRQEMQALARLDHANIVHLIEFDETPDNTPYMVMNFIPGDSLHKRINKGKLDIATRDRVLKELCNALDYIHSQNVVHRDLKPANILFDALDHVRIGDFGLAKLVDTTYVASVPGGTPRFQAPEQSAEAIDATLPQGEKATIDHRADIYALGVIAWLLFTGQYPDDPPTANRPSPKLEQALLKALEYHREDRYNSAGEFWQALTAATLRGHRLPIWAWGGIGIGILLLVVAGAWLIQPGSRVAPGPGLATTQTTAPATATFVSTAAPTPVPATAMPSAVDTLLSSPTSTLSVISSPPPPPTPTATPSFEPTPTPYLTVSDNKVNVYDGPGQEYTIQEQVAKGDILPILGRSEDRVWLYVDYLGWPLWIPVQAIATDADIQTLSTVEAPPTPVNQPPVIETIETIKACSAISVTCTVSDQGNDDLTYTWEASDGFITGEGDSVTYNASEAVGDQTITVTVPGLTGQNTSSLQVQIVSASPSPGTSEPIGIFGQTWHECEIRRKLGWATGEDAATLGAQQYFDDGMMFWREDTGQIYVLMLDGTWYVYPGIWEEGMDEYSCASDSIPRNTPPTPKRGFGKVWCDQLGGPNSAIGWAQDNEQGYQTHWQTFEHGLMGEGYDKYIYVLYVNQDGNPAWHSYPSFASRSDFDPTSQRIQIGERAWVCTAYDSLAVRAGPGRDSSEIIRLEPGEYVTIVDGPAYANSWLWWQVHTDSGAVGWVAEGGDAVDPYYICPER